MTENSTTKGTTNTSAGDSGEGPDTSGFLDYLRVNRDLMTPAVESAVRSIDLTPQVHQAQQPRQAIHQAPQTPQARPLRILDAGTGAGGALPALASLLQAAEHGGTVTAIDLSDQAIETVSKDIAGRPWQELVDLRQADLREVARSAAAGGETYDLIWSSDVVWPATFESPAEVVRELAGALAPGGILALFTTNYYQSMFLPGHSRLERLIRTASELTWGLPDDGPTHYERLGAWMHEAGLLEVTLRAFPITASAASDSPARTYLERVAWPEMRHAVAANGRTAGMSEADIAQAESLLDPDSPAWAGSDPHTFLVHPTLLWTGRAPAR